MQRVVAPAYLKELVRTCCLEVMSATPESLEQYRQEVQELQALVAGFRQEVAGIKVTKAMSGGSDEALALDERTRDEPSAALHLSKGQLKHPALRHAPTWAQHCPMQQNGYNTPHRLGSSTRGVWELSPLLDVHPALGYTSLCQVYIEIESAPVESWYENRVMPPITLKLVDDQSPPNLVPMSGIWLSAVLVNGRGLLEERTANGIGHLLVGDREVAVQNGYATFHNLKVCEISSKHYGSFQLSISAHGCPEGVSVNPMRTKNFVVQVGRLWSKRRKSEAEVSPDDPISQIPGVGKQYITRLQAQGIVHIRQFAEIASTANGREKLHRLFKGDKAKNGFNDTKFNQMLEQADKVMLHAANYGGPDGILPPLRGAVSSLHFSGLVHSSSGDGSGEHGDGECGDGHGLSIAPKRGRVLAEQHNGGEGGGMDGLAMTAGANGTFSSHGRPILLPPVSHSLAITSAAEHAAMSSAGGGLAGDHLCRCAGGGITGGTGASGSMTGAQDSSMLAASQTDVYASPSSTNPTSCAFEWSGQKGVKKLAEDDRCGSERGGGGNTAAEAAPAADGTVAAAGDELSVDELMELFTDEVPEQELSWRSARGGANSELTRSTGWKGGSGGVAVGTGMRMLMQSVHEQHLQPQQCDVPLVAMQLDAAKIPRPRPLSPVNFLGAAPMALCSGGTTASGAKGTCNVPILSAPRLLLTTRKAVPAAGNIEAVALHFPAEEQQSRYRSCRLAPQRATTHLSVRRASLACCHNTEDMEGLRQELARLGLRSCTAALN